MVRYDNEVGKGDHRHIDEKESAYNFTTPDKLIADRAEGGGIVFPFDAVKVEFLLRAAS